MDDKVQKEAIERIEENPVLLADFQQFLRERFIEELYVFRKEVLHFKNEFVNRKSQEIKERANAIYNNLIAEGAPMQVNISDLMRKGIENALHSDTEIPESIFNDALKEVTLVLNHNVLTSTSSSRHMTFVEPEEKSDDVVGLLANETARQILSEHLLRKEQPQMAALVRFYGICCEMSECTDPKVIDMMGRMIINVFIQPGALHEISIEPKLRSKILKITSFSADTFEELKSMAREILDDSTLIYDLIYDERIFSDEANKERSCDQNGRRRQSLSFSALNSDELSKMIGQVVSIILDNPTDRRLLINQLQEQGNDYESFLCRFYVACRDLQSMGNKDQKVLHLMGRKIVSTFIEPGAIYEVPDNYLAPAMKSKLSRMKLAQFDVGTFNAAAMDTIYSIEHNAKIAAAAIKIAKHPGDKAEGSKT